MKRIFSGGRAYKIHCMHPPILIGVHETNYTNEFVSCGGYGVA